jgi:ABC-2 type transport system ATP-binding protein
VVVFDGVTKVYGAVTAVNGLSFTLRRGETVAFLGPNGAGKSTSLDMLLGLRRPTSGAVALFGTTPNGAIEGGRVGAMLQSGGLMTDVTVRELVALCTALHPRPLPVDETLRRADLTEIADRKVDKLSGGQKQRVRFSLAIVGQSDLLVLDEPTSAMDVETRQAFWTTMKAEAAAGRTVIFATHYLEEADQVADRIIVINKGRLLADGTPADIKAKAGAKRLSFRLDGASDLAMRGLPGVVDVEIRHDLVRLQSSDSDATLYALLDTGARPREIEVGSLGLEQAFLAITAEDNAEEVAA